MSSVRNSPVANNDEEARARKNRREKEESGWTKGMSEGGGLQDDEDERAQ
jgi:hypothetical protein